MKKCLLNWKYIYYSRYIITKCYQEKAFVVLFGYCPGFLNYFLKIKYKQFTKVTVANQFVNFANILFCSLFLTKIRQNKHYSPFHFLKATPSLFPTSYLIFSFAMKLANIKWRDELNFALLEIIREQ